MNLANKIEMDLLLYLLESDYEIILPRHYLGMYECDVFGVTASNYTIEYEVKTSVTDFKKDFEKSNGYSKKHNSIQQGKRTNKFIFVVPEGMITVEDIPEGYGLIYVVKGRYANGRFNFKTIKYAKFLHKSKFEYNSREAKHIIKKLYYKYRDRLMQDYLKLEKLKAESK